MIWLKAICVGEVFNIPLIFRIVQIQLFADELLELQIIMVGLCKECNLKSRIASICQKCDKIITGKMYKCDVYGVFKQQGKSLRQVPLDSSGFFMFT